MSTSFARGAAALLGTLALVGLPLPVVAAESAPSSSAVTGVSLTAHPHEVAFGKRQVGRTYYKSTRIIVGGDRPVRLLVEAGLPDDFGFGLMPGSTCPVLDGGAVVDPGYSCRAVVRFTPTEGFVGWQAKGEMLARAFDPDSGEQLVLLVVPVTGEATLRPSGGGD